MSPPTVGEVATGTPSVSVAFSEHPVPLAKAGRGVPGVHVYMTRPPLTPAVPTAVVGTIPLRFTDGAVTVSMLRPFERSVSVSGVALTSDLLEAVESGQRMRCYDADGNALGVFCDLAIEHDRPRDTYTITGEDLATLISADTWVDKPAGHFLTANPYDNIARVLVAVDPDVVIGWGWTPSAGAPSNPALRSGDPWAFAQSLAFAAGMRLYFDASGAARLRILRPVVGGTVLTGALSISPEFTVRDVKNVIVAQSTQFDEAASVITVVVQDTSTAISVANIGRRVEVYQAPDGMSAVELTAVCNLKLANYLARSRMCGWTVLYSPGLQVNQIYSIDGRPYRVESMNIPLTPNSRTVVNGGDTWDLPTIAAKIRPPDKPPPPDKLQTIIDLEATGFVLTAALRSPDEDWNSDSPPTMRLEVVPPVPEETEPRAVVQEFTVDQPATGEVVQYRAIYTGDRRHLPSTSNIIDVLDDGAVPDPDPYAPPDGGGGEGGASSGAGLVRGTLISYNAGARTCRFRPDGAPAGGAEDWYDVAVAEHVGTPALDVPCWAAKKDA